MGEVGEKMAREQIAYIKQPFLMEDLPMLELQQRNMGGQDFWDLKPVLLAGDAGGVRARRALDKLLAAEIGVTAAAENRSVARN
jgi:hypothetical protein